MDGFIEVSLLVYANSWDEVVDTFSDPTCDINVRLCDISPVVVMK